jgi:vanillate O-demethylase ferredoxin subunit
MGNLLDQATERFDTRLHSIQWAANGILLFELRPLEESFPDHEAGAHIDVHLPNGLVRRYSLVNPEGDTKRYVIAVHRDPASRGGSRYMHEMLRVGDTLRIGAPRNDFRLVEDAKHSVFIAGGIGVTPLWSMMQRMSTLKASWEFYYAARTRHDAAFVEEIEELGRRSGRRVVFHFDNAEGNRLLDLRPIVRAAKPDTHLYCCGPKPMLAAFLDACEKRPRDTVHVEYFSALTPPAIGGGFSVTLAKSGMKVYVPEGKTILDALLAAGIDIPFSCNEGVCGSCATRVISGIPDHRDVVLTEAERESGETMMICCSGSRSEALVLDL